MTIKNNLYASGAPTADNDETQGYSDRSRWIDVSTMAEYRCIDATAAAADWIEVNPESRYWSVGGELGPEWVSGTSDGAVTFDRLMLMPWTFRRRVQIDKISIRLTVAGSAGSAMRVGLFRNNPDVYDGLILLRETAPFALDINATGSPRVGPDDLAWDVRPGNVLFGFLFNNVTTMPQMTRINACNRGGQIPRSEGGDMSGSSVFMRSANVSYGAMPATVTAPPLAGDVAPFFQLLRGA